MMVLGDRLALLERRLEEATNKGPMNGQRQGQQQERQGLQLQEQRQGLTGTTGDRLAQLEREMNTMWELMKVSHGIQGEQQGLHGQQGLQGQQERPIETSATPGGAKGEEPIEVSAALGGARAVVLPSREEQQEQELAEVSGVTITEIIAGADVKAKGIRMSGEIGMFVDTGRPPGRLLGG